MSMKNNYNYIYRIMKTFIPCRNDGYIGYSLYAHLEPPLILFIHVMNLWRLTRRDCIPLAPQPLTSPGVWPMGDTSKGLAEKAMSAHSSTLTWKIPWVEEPGGLQSMGSLRVGHNWPTSLSLFTFMHWRRKWRPTPVFLPGESQGQGSLMGSHLWGRTESDTTEAT